MSSREERKMRDMVARIERLEQEDKHGSMNGSRVSSSPPGTDRKRKRSLQTTSPTVKKTTTTKKKERKSPSKHRTPSSRDYSSSYSSGFDEGAESEMSTDDDIDWLPPKLVLVRKFFRAKEKEKARSLMLSPDSVSSHRTVNTARESLSPSDTDISSRKGSIATNASTGKKEERKAEIKSSLSPSLVAKSVSPLTKPSLLPTETTKETSTPKGNGPDLADLFSDAVDETIPSTSKVALVQSEPVLPVQPTSVTASAAAVTTPARPSPPQVQQQPPKPEPAVPQRLPSAAQPSAQPPYATPQRPQHPHQPPAASVSIPTAPTVANGALVNPAPLRVQVPAPSVQPTPTTQTPGQVHSPFVPASSPLLSTPTGVRAPTTGVTPVQGTPSETTPIVHPPKPVKKLSFADYKKKQQPVANKPSTSVTSIASASEEKK